MPVRQHLRGKKTSWETFQKSHWDAIAATAFFSVEVLTPRGLVRDLVLFVIDLNAYGERFVGSIKSECLSKIIPLGEWHFRLIVSEFAAQYHLERNHQGLDNRLIERARGQPPDVGRVSCRERLGGVLKFYYREAA